MSVDQNGPDELEYTALERELFGGLAREAGDADSRGADMLVDALRAEGFFGRQRRPAIARQMAAAMLLLTIGAGAGTVFGARITLQRSLEGMLERTDLSLGDRVLLMQRAGSAYVRAADAYANATRDMDSTAVEVASQVLIGAAQAMARNRLDGGVGPRVAAVMETIPGAQRAPSPSLIWY